MPRLTRLRIAGFKSFAEPVSLEILPGLTGVVGPNGCGKSNVVEALRWAMGETSARILRGGEMDDVIFAGTTARASRNLAEVTVTLEGSPLPAPFEAEAELQVTRRIERGTGSIFRANGRELRVRDVQTLYADLASGARSSGMVSQGRVADLVRARPEERRQVLEEAAGITGLHARRHEAELKLRAAEQNVTRAGDASTQLDGMRDTLRRQARQAARYRALSGLIRSAEAEHLAILQAAAAERVACARAGYRQAETDLAAALGHEAATSAALTDAEAALPLLRDEASNARSAVERCGFETEALAARACREIREAEAAEASVMERAADLAVAVRSERDAEQAVQRLSAFVDALAARLAVLPDQSEAAESAARKMRAALHEAQAEADETTRRASAAAGSAGNIHAALHAAAARRETVQGQHEALSAELAAIARRRTDERQLVAAATASAEAGAALLATRAASASAEAARAQAMDALAPARTRSEREQARRQTAVSALDTATTRAERLATACREAEDAVRHHRSVRVDADAARQASRAADFADLGLSQAEASLERMEQLAIAAEAAAASAGRVAEDGRAAAVRAHGAVSAAEARAARIAADLYAAEAAWAEAGRDPDSDTRARGVLLRREAEQAFAASHDTWMCLKEAGRSAEQALDRARAGLSDARAGAARLYAEIEGLETAGGIDDGAPDLLGVLELPDGLERAFGAAFGEAACATLDTPSLGQPGARAWRTLPPMAQAALPPGSIALASLVTAPPGLARMLTHVALLEGDTDGDAVQPILQAGMIAVNRAGACWRWDGLFTPADAPNPAALRLALRRRLTQTRAGLAAASRNAEAAGARLGTAESEAQLSGDRELAANHARTAAETALHAARQTVERQRYESAQSAARRSALEAAVKILRAEREAADATVRAAEAEATALPDQAVLDDDARSAATRSQAARQSVEAARIARAAARAQSAEAHRVAQRLAGDASRTEAEFQAAAAALARAVADRQAAGQALADAQAALAVLPDPLVLAAALAAAETAEAGCRAAEAEAHRLRGLAETELDRARQAETLMRRCHAEAEAMHAGAHDRVERSRADLDEAAAQAQRAEAACIALPDTGALEASAESARNAFETARRATLEVEAAALGLAAELASAMRMHGESSTELQAWHDRMEEARSRGTALALRHRAAEAAWREAALRPAETAAQSDLAAHALHAAQQRLDTADAALASAGLQARNLSARWRSLSEQAAVLRDARSRLDAECAARETACGAVLARAAERLGPDAALPPADDHSDVAAERARKRHERLCREREEMGPVNLRAELELEEIDRRMGALARECDELGQAAAKLHGAIGQLNREGRERLLAVFTQVDQHFRVLFTRMMGGGRAHLAMTGGDDPLAAGLEIYAEPPGKKLSALSLLSGGEQALTALSLILAVFRCTPSPLCVLDEVDAPLDDANVERFCTLLDDVVRDTGTSFLVVTHHQVTMSRMDRLFGVTMQERGVSRLLSVDLGRAVRMTATDASEPMLHAAE